MTEKTPETGSMKRNVWVVEIEDTEGNLFKNSLTPEGEDTEGQGWIRGWLKPVGEDTEGQMWRRLGQTEDGKYLIEIDSEDDVAGQGLRHSILGQTEEDVEGQTGGGKIAETAEDSEGKAVTLTFVRRATEDDTKGHLFKHLKPEGEDTEGQGYRQREPRGGGGEGGQGSV